jgi:hypothetical protein
MRPAAKGTTGDPFEALAAELLEKNALPELVDAENSDPVADLAYGLRENPEAVTQRIRDTLDAVASKWKLEKAQALAKYETEMQTARRFADAEQARDQRERLVEPRAGLALVVDQLEELFSGGFSRDTQDRFVQAIAGLIRTKRIYVVATLRSDYYARYQEFPELVELTKPQGKFDLRPPSSSELGDIIRKPAEAAGLRFDSHPDSGQRLDEALRDAAREHPESLPLLEHVLEQLFKAQQSRGDDLLRWSSRI